MTGVAMPRMMRIHVTLIPRELSLSVFVTPCPHQHILSHVDVFVGTIRHIATNARLVALHLTVNKSEKKGNEKHYTAQKEEQMVSLRSTEEAPRVFHVGTCVSKEWRANLALVLSMSGLATWHLWCQRGACQLGTCGVKEGHGTLALVVSKRGVPTCDFWCQRGACQRRTCVVSAKRCNLAL